MFDMELCEETGMEWVENNKAGLTWHEKPLMEFQGLKYTCESEIARAIGRWFSNRSWWVLLSGSTRCQRISSE